MVGMQSGLFYVLVILVLALRSTTNHQPFKIQVTLLVLCWKVVHLPCRPPRLSLRVTTWSHETTRFVLEAHVLNQDHVGNLQGTATSIGFGLHFDQTITNSGMTNVKVLSAKAGKNVHRDKLHTLVIYSDQLLASKYSL